MALTNAAAKNAKAKDKPYKLADADGMFLFVKCNGLKYWRFKYRFSDKEKLLALGVYPDVTLIDARKQRDHARELLRGSIDPGHAKQEKKALDCCR
jgi:hypothetical protein